MVAVLKDGHQWLTLSCHSHSCAVYPTLLQGGLGGQQEDRFDGDFIFSAADIKGAVTFQFFICCSGRATVSVPGVMCSAALWSDPHSEDWGFLPTAHVGFGSGFHPQLSSLADIWLTTCEKLPCARNIQVSCSPILDPQRLWDNKRLLFWATNLRNCLLCSDR